MTRKNVDQEGSFIVCEGQAEKNLVACMKVAQTERFGLSLGDGLNIARLLLMPEAMLHGRRIEEFFSRQFFSTEFWYLWPTWSSTRGALPEDGAIEFRRYMNRFKYLFGPRMVLTRRRPEPLSPPSQRIVAQGRGQVTFTAKAHRYTPPKGALIDWLTPPEYADDRIHALLTGYDRWVQKYGIRTAGRIFFVQSIGVVFGFWVYWLGKHINLLKLFRPSS
jgi:hypothetical protein